MVVESEGLEMTFTVETWLPGAESASSTSGAFARLSDALREFATRLDTITVSGTGVRLTDDSSESSYLLWEYWESQWMDVL